MSSPEDTRDRLARPLRDLRISVTDRCNFRCAYCMPRESFGADFPFLPRSEILSFEEVHRLASLFVQLGVRKIRLTGGEPLLRADLPVLVRLLAGLPEIEVALTTNGSLLVHQAEELAAAGLTRVTVSIDSLNDGVFRRMNDVEMPVERILRGIQAAVEVGLTPVKVNAVVKRGTNDHLVEELARYCKAQGLIARFIEYMDVGTRNGWRLEEVVSGAEIVARITSSEPADPVTPARRGEVARRWRYRDGEGEFGVVTSVTQPFCGDCTRARLSADGRLFTCLFASDGVDLRAPLRRGADDRTLRDLIAETWTGRTDRYSELRSAETARDGRVEMSYIGG